MEAFVAICAALMLFVNGATDTPACIAGAVASGALSYGRASALCAAGNLLGTVISCIAFPQVAGTVASLAGLPIECIAASLLSAVTFSSVAWLFGIPTSESHGLIASLGGASLYLHGCTGDNFGRIATYSLLSCVTGALAGYLVMLFVKKSADEKSHPAYLALSAAGTSFCHGMQDGQKLAAILAISVSGGVLTRSISATAAGVLAVGCFFGGKRMISKLGCELAGGFRSAEALSSDLAAFVCCNVSSLLGIPISTTYMKTFAMIGAARAVNRKTDVKTLGALILAWCVTYPVCMLLSYTFCMVISLIG